MATISYETRRGRIEDYFDRTAADAWARLTSDEPVGRIRATVRAGRDRMRQTLLDWLPLELAGKRVLDAGCGTGALAIEAARRGAHVTAIDLSSTLVDLARQRAPDHFDGGSLEFKVGDMLDPKLGEFDHVVAMDSLIHYAAPDVIRVLRTLSPRTAGSILFTFAPRTPALAAMHAVGRLFPKSDRAPSIEPVSEKRLHTLLADEATMRHRRPGRSLRVSSGFYTSQALEYAIA